MDTGKTNNDSYHAEPDHQFHSAGTPVLRPAESPKGGSGIPYGLQKAAGKGHPSYGMLMGCFIGKALYTGKRSCRVSALVLPFLLHGMYDFSLSEEYQALNDNLVFVPFLIVAAELAVLIRMLFLIRKEKRGTMYTKALRECRSLAGAGRETPGPDGGTACLPRQGTTNLRRICR